MRNEKILGKGSLKGKSVVIVGVGGTGCAVAQLLSRLGLKLILIDRDLVEETNIERQILFNKSDIGKPKVTAAKERLGNAEARFEDVNHQTIDLDADLVIDCTDNIETRLLINDYCKKKGIPWIYTGAVGRIGAVYFNKNACFSCFNKSNYGQTCSEVGVLNTTVSLVGSIAAAIAVDYLALGKVEEDLIRINMENNALEKIKIKKDPDCNPCNGRFNYLDGTETKKFIKFCSRGRYHFFLNRKIDLAEIGKRLGGRIDDYSVSTKDFVIFSHGRVIVHAENEIQAKKKYDELIGI